MKAIVKSIALGMAVVSFSAFLPADDCSLYIPAKEGSETEYKTYNDDNKFTGMSRNKIISVKKGAAGQQVEIQSESFDKKEKPVGTSTYVVGCENGSFSVDMQSMITKEQKESFKDAKATITADKLDIPANPQVGQNLKNGSLKMTTVTSESPIGLTLSVAITNRKVAAIEDVTVPAGTFKCVKITYDAESKMIFTVRTKGVEWYAKDVGLVKSETYSSKDKLMGYTVLNSKK
jgi:AAA15 family ATPase/GTPase